jgi:S-formylglutathione hydrolase FrmB
VSENEQNEIQGTWSIEKIDGHEIDIYEPPKRNPHGYVLIYLHGVHLGRLIDKPQYCEVFDKYGLPVVAPMTQRSWWANIICEEFSTEYSAENYVLNKILPFVQEQYETKIGAIGLFGTSMGGHGALRLSYKHPDTFPVVAGISPAIDHYKHYYEYETLMEMYSDGEAVRQDSAILHIHPLNWPRNQWFCCDPVDEYWFDGSDRLKMKLHSLGIMFESELEKSAGGHGWDYYNTMAEPAIDFVYQGLENERKRLEVIAMTQEDTEE